MSVNKKAIEDIIARMKAREAVYKRETEEDYKRMFSHVIEFDTYQEMYDFARKVSPTYERFCQSMLIMTPLFFDKKKL